MSTFGTGVSTSVVTGIELLTRFAMFDLPTEEHGVTTDIDGNMLPAGHTTADFLSGHAVELRAAAAAAERTDADVRRERIQFDGVTPGTQVTFTSSRSTTSCRRPNVAQIFLATIKVLAGGCNVLDSRSVLILVPPIADRVPVGNCATVACAHGTFMMVHTRGHTRVIPAEYGSFIGTLNRAQVVQVLRV